MNKHKNLKIRIGVIGLGRIGWSRHIPLIKKSRDFELAAVSDTSLDRCKEATEKYGCAAFLTQDEMIANSTLDAIVIATPTHLHKSMAIKAFKANLDVLLEKPMALDLKEARLISTSAKKHQRILTVYQPHRLKAYHQTLKKIIASGKLGEIYHIRRGMFSFAQRNDWQCLKKYGGGMLSNYGAHGLDQLLDITGSKIKKIYCTLRRVASLGDTDDVVKIIYETRSGIIGELDINQASTMNPYEFEVYGTTGSAQLDGDKYIVRYFNPKFLKNKKINRNLMAENRQYPNDNIKINKIDIQIKDKHGIDVYKDFANAIRTRSNPVVIPEETITVMKLIESCRDIAGTIQVTPIREVSRVDTEGVS